MVVVISMPGSGGGGSKFTGISNFVTPCLMIKEFHFYKKSQLPNSVLHTWREFFGQLLYQNIGVIPIQDIKIDFVATFGYFHTVE